MDYSLLVGIHDCDFLPGSDDEQIEDIVDDGDEYISSDDVGDTLQSHGKHLILDKDYFVIASTQYNLCIYNSFVYICRNSRVLPYDLTGCAVFDIGRLK